MPYYVANQKVRCSVEQSLCLEILLLPAKYKESRILSVNAILKRILAPLYQDSAKRALVSSLYPNRKKDAFLTVNQFYAKVRIAARSKQQCRETRRWPMYDSDWKKMDIHPRHFHEFHRWFYFIFFYSLHPRVPILQNLTKTKVDNWIQKYQKLGIVS